MTIDERRKLEWKKYSELAWNPGSTYGSTNHGRHAMALVTRSNPGFVIDFGCGRNNFIRELRRLGIDGLGVDFAFPQAGIERPMHETKLLGGVADVVTSFDALEHLLPEDVDASLSEMRRVAKTRGRFIFSIATKPSRITVGGENLHMTVQPLTWWLGKIAAVGTVSERAAAGRYVTGSFHA